MAGCIDWSGSWIRDFRDWRLWDYSAAGDRSAGGPDCQSSFEAGIARSGARGRRGVRICRIVADTAVSVFYHLPMSGDQESDTEALPKDWRIVLNLSGSALLIAFIVLMIAYPIYRKGRSERFEARAEKAFGVLPALNRVADEVQAEFRTTYPGSKIDIGASFAKLGAIMDGEKKIEPKEFSTGENFQLMVFNLSEEDLPRLNPILARALARHGVERVKVSPVFDRMEEIKVIHGKEIRMGGGYSEIGEAYTVEALK